MRLIQLLRFDHPYPDEVPTGVLLDRIVETDADVAMSLRDCFGESQNRVNLTVANLWGLYAIRRSRDMDVLSSYQETLKDYIEITDP